MSKKSEEYLDEKNGHNIVDGDSDDEMESDEIDSQNSSCVKLATNDFSGKRNISLSYVARCR